jgi:putative ABC transport system substrate-binding protein
MHHRAAALLAVFVVTVVTAPHLAQAQAGIHRVALLMPFSTAEALPYRDAFFEGMRHLGYVEGRNVVFDVRTSDRDRARVSALLDDMISLKPDVLVSDGNAAELMRAKTTSIPIVLAVSGDPVRAGLAHSWARPGMNLTGIVGPALASKHIEIMREIIPQLARVGVFVDITASACDTLEESARQAARTLGAVLVAYPVANREEIVRAFSRMDKQRPDMLIPCPTAMLFNNRDLLFESAVRLRIPFTSFVVANLPLGVLFSYSVSFVDGYRKAATYVDKILKGAKPGDLPLEQPTRFELVINMKTARTFGLTIPPSLLLRADQVIE